MSSCYARKCEKMGSSWQMSPETGPEMFLKAQIAVSEVLSQQCFNTAVFYALVACAKRKLKAAIFKTGRSCGKNRLKTSKKSTF